MSNINLWQKLNKPFTVLAPMANVTDWAFRQIVIEAGRSAFAEATADKPDVFFTEFISADGIVAMGPNKFRGELYFTDNERPIVVQFFSANPDNMYKCAQLAQELGFDGIDINMGCPDKSVEKQGAGAALIKNPELAIEIIKKTVSGSGKLPVSVKTRLGYNKVDYDWFKYLLSTAITTITIHGRTRKEMSKVSARWEEIGKISEMARGSGKIIVGNGDVMNMEDTLGKAKRYCLDGIMVGRGIFQNPWFFTGKEIFDAKERISLLIKHLENFNKLWNPPNGGKKFDVMKRFFKIYINGWPGAKELRTKLMSAKNIGEAVDFISKVKMLY